MNFIFVSNFLKVQLDYKIINIQFSCHSKIKELNYKYSFRVFGGFFYLFCFTMGEKENKRERGKQEYKRE